MCEEGVPFRVGTVDVIALASCCRLLLLLLKVPFSSEFRRDTREGLANRINKALPRRPKDRRVDVAAV